MGPTRWRAAAGRARAALVVEAPPKVATFADVARDYIRVHRASWQNAKHAEQCECTLRTYAEPVFGATPVDAIDRELVLGALMPIWAEEPATATRVRSRIELVVNYARGARPAHRRAPGCVAGQSGRGAAEAAEGHGHRSPPCSALRANADVPGRAAAAGRIGRSLT